LHFIFVDRVVSLVRNERITALRQLTAAEEIFQQHFPGNPMLPASLIIEACAQAATMLLETSSGFESKAFVGFVEKSKFRHPVRPGYEMQMELLIKQMGGNGALVSGSVVQRNRKCATVHLGMVMSPMKDFFPAAQRTAYLGLYPPWLAETEFTDFDFDPLERLARVLD